MPVTGGALLDFSGLVGPEGSFVKKLKRLGCVILHKVKTVEFTYGPVGTNAVLGFPRRSARLAGSTWCVLLDSGLSRMPCFD